MKVTDKQIIEALQETNGFRNKAAALLNIAQRNNR